MLLLAILIQVTTTSCRPVLGEVQCTSRTAPSGPIQYPTTAVDGQAMANLGSALRYRKQNGRRKKVGKLVAAGKCDEATAFALNKGELELADYVRAYCRKP